MRYPTLILVLALAASAQVPDGITTTVSRTVNITPDEADFSIAVSTSLDNTQDQVTQTFRDAGIQNLTVSLLGAYQVYPTRGPAASQLNYQITFTTAPAALAGYSKKLDSINASLPDSFAFLQYSAALNASQAAIDAAHQTTLPQLLQDARTKAQALASAAGLKLGAITGVTETSNGATGFAFQSISGVLGSFISSSTNPSTPYTFFATVKFAAQ